MEKTQLQPIQYSVHNKTVIIETSRGWLALTAYSENIIRVRYALTQAFSTKESLMIQSSSNLPVEMEVSETADALVVMIIPSEFRAAFHKFYDGSLSFSCSRPHCGHCFIWLFVPFYCFNSISIASKTFDPTFLMTCLVPAFCQT